MLLIISMNFIDDYRIEEELTDEQFIAKAKDHVEWELKHLSKEAMLAREEKIWLWGEVIVYKERFEYNGVPYKLHISRHYNLDDMDLTRRHDKKIVCLSYPKKLNEFVDLVATMIQDLNPNLIETLFEPREFLEMCFGNLMNVHRMSDWPLREQVELAHQTVKEQVDYLETLQEQYEEWLKTKRDVCKNFNKQVSKWLDEL